MAQDVSKELVEKAMAEIEQMAKARGIDLNKGALYHTPASSMPSTYPGGEQHPVTDADAFAAISSGGTEYSDVKTALINKAMSGSLTKAEASILAGLNPLPEIMAKAERRETLTPFEQWAVKGGAIKMAKSGMEAPAHEKEPEKVPETEKKPDEQHEEKAMSKALDLIREFMAKSQVAAPSASDAQLREIQKALAERKEFEDQVAKSIVLLGEQIRVSGEMVNQMAAGPARGPLSQHPQMAAPVGQQGQAMNKGFGPFDGSEMSRTQVGHKLADLVMKGSPGVTELDVYDWTIEPKLRDDLATRVKAN